LTIIITTEAKTGLFGRVYNSYRDKGRGQDFTR